MHKARAIFTGITLSALAAVVAAGISACGGSDDPMKSGPTHVMGKSKEEIGKYITQIGGCNDCHTAAVMAGKELKDVPEDQWLTGSPLGFNGPWGTSYAQNLRQKAAAFTTETFIQSIRTRKDKRPPMPWSALEAMSDADLGAVFSYIKSLPVTGTAAPEPLPPGKDPQQPFIVMVPGVSPPFPAGPAPAPAPATAPAK